jgi:hypothetical protein
VGLKKHLIKSETVFKPESTPIETQQPGLKAWFSQFNSVRNERERPLTRL